MKSQKKVIDDIDLVLHLIAGYPIKIDFNQSKGFLDPEHKIPADISKLTIEIFYSLNPKEHEGKILDISDRVQ